MESFSVAGRKSLGGLCYLGVFFVVVELLAGAGLN